LTSIRPQIDLNHRVKDKDKDKDKEKDNYYNIIYKQKFVFFKNNI